MGLCGIVNLESLILNPRSRIVESEAVIQDARDERFRMRDSRIHTYVTPKDAQG